MKEVGNYINERALATISELRRLGRNSAGRGRRAKIERQKSRCP